MLGCAYEDAFPDTTAQSGRVAKREERRRAEKCKGPALSFLKAAEGKDPDRQHLNPLPPVPPLGAGLGADVTGPVPYGSALGGGNRGHEAFQDFSDQQPSNIQYKPQVMDATKQEALEYVQALVGQRVDDVIGEKSRNTLPRGIESSTQLPTSSKTMYGQKNPSYFGKDISDAGRDVQPGSMNGKAAPAQEGFQNFSSVLGDKRGYELVSPADFQASFAATGVGKASGEGNLPIPALDDVWKPLTPSGARTSYLEAPPVYGPGSSSSSMLAGFNRDEKETLVKKLDTLFARLEELESKRNENAHLEVSLFILSGLFLIFGLESVRKL